jgi:demethylmenaquinone methyltransferase/2-methoxy-6-polyprenyl-1,4-benzoquinol methylase
MAEQLSKHLIGSWSILEHPFEMQSTRALFNSRAATWDQLHTHDPAKISLMLALSDLSPGMDFLDVGCGTGVLEPYLLRYQPRRVIAVDFAEKMIEIARKKLQDPRVEFLCADVFSLQGELCDCCFLYNAFPHFSDPHRLLEHLFTLIRPGGRLSISHTRGKAGDAYLGQVLYGHPVHPNQGLVNLMRPYFHVDATVDNGALFFISGTRRA